MVERDDNEQTGFRQVITELCRRGRVFMRDLSRTAGLRTHELFWFRPIMPALPLGLRITCAEASQRLGPQTLALLFGESEMTPVVDLKILFAEIRAHDPNA